MYVYQFRYGCGLRSQEEEEVRMMIEYNGDYVGGRLRIGCSVCEN